MVGEHLCNRVTLNGGIACDRFGLENEGLHSLRVNAALQTILSGASHH